MPYALSSLGGGPDADFDPRSSAAAAQLQEAGSAPASPRHSPGQHPQGTTPHTGWYPQQQGAMPQAGEGVGVAPSGHAQQAQQESQPEQTEEEKAAVAAAAAEERRQEDAVLARARSIRELLGAAKVRTRLPAVRPCGRRRLGKCPLPALLLAGGCCWRWPGPPAGPGHPLLRRTVGPPGFPPVATRAAPSAGPPCCCIPL